MIGQGVVGVDGAAAAVAVSAAVLPVVRRAAAAAAVIGTTGPVGYKTGEEGSNQVAQLEKIIHLIIVKVGTIINH